MTVEKRKRNSETVGLDRDPRWKTRSGVTRPRQTDTTEKDSRDFRRSSGDNNEASRTLLFVVVESFRSSCVLLLDALARPVESPPLTRPPFPLLGGRGKRREGHGKVSTHTVPRVGRRGRGRLSRSPRVSRNLLYLGRDSRTHRTILTNTRVQGYQEPFRDVQYTTTMGKTSLRVSQSGLNHVFPGSVLKGGPDCGFGSEAGGTSQEDYFPSYRVGNDYRVETTREYLTGGKSRVRRGLWSRGVCDHRPYKGFALVGNGKT